MRPLRLRQKRRADPGAAYVRTDVERRYQSPFDRDVAEYAVGSLDDAHLTLGEHHVAVERHDVG